MLLSNATCLPLPRGAELSPFLDLNGMDFNSVFDVPLGEKDTAGLCKLNPV